MLALFSCLRVLGGAVMTCLTTKSFWHSRVPYALTLGFTWHARICESTLHVCTMAASSFGGFVRGYL